MSGSSFEHPSLASRVTTEQRERAEQHLQQAYAEGRITEEEFDRRIGQVLGATTRKDLNEAFYGLVEVPTAPRPSAPLQSYGYTGSSQYPVRQQGTTGGALAHFSGLFLMPLGPGVAYAVSPAGSPARKESAKAFNFQLLSLIAVVVGGTLTGITSWGLLEFLMGLGAIAWVVLSIIGGVKAAQGSDWQNPVTKVAKLKVLPEK